MDNDDHGADEAVEDVSDEAHQVTSKTWKRRIVRDCVMAKESMMKQHCNAFYPLPLFLYLCEGL